MSPKSETNILHGPPTPSKLAREASSDSNLGNESIERSFTDMSDCIVFFINKANLCQSPQVEIKVVGRIVINSILDSGSEVNLLSERVYEKLTQPHVDVPLLSVEHVVLVTAFGKRFKRIKRQALIVFTVGNNLFESVFMVSSSLRIKQLLVVNFKKKDGVSINFDRGTFSYVRGAELREHSFMTKVGLKKVISDNPRVIGDVSAKITHPEVSDLNPSQLTVKATSQPEQLTAVPTPPNTRPVQQVLLETEAQGMAFQLFMRPGVGLKK
jgi:hypothetical protein